MPLRNSKPFTFRPRGVCDAKDSTNIRPGALQSCVNLIPAPSDKNAFVCRPASALLNDFSGFTTPTQITCLLVIGNIAYGMVSSGRFANHDEPFAYNILTNTFLTINGVLSANTPASPALTGDWTPPTAAVVGNRVIFTHPGFSGGAGPFFGWLDFTGFTLTTLTGNVTNGSAVIASISGDGTSNPILDGVQPGQTITAGALFPAGTTVVSVKNGTTSINTTCNTHSNTTVDGIPTTAGMAPGMYLTGPDFAPGTFISSITSSVAIVISQNATATATGTTVNVSGGGSITVSNAATGATTNLQALSISGGSAGTPLWGAGNTNVFPLASVPTAVSQFNNRAWFAVANTLVFSDSLNPLNVTNANQALTMGDTTSVTALAGLPLSNQVLGGVLQSLIAFKGDSFMYQITGDAATSNLAQNAINQSVGTIAPNSICATPKGLAFIAPDGLRFLNFQAQLSDPVGAYGEGICVPFQLAVNPTRISAAYNQNIYRVTVQNGSVSGNPTQEYWLDMTENTWSGPHSFGAGLIEAYQAPTGANTGHGFVMSPVAAPQKLFGSDGTPTLSSSYVENGTQMTWELTTSLLPDNQEMEMNAVVQSTIMIQVPQPVTIIAQDEEASVIDQVTIDGIIQAPTVWGSFNWGGSTWGGETGSFFEQRRISWTRPLEFKQMAIQFSGNSDPDFMIGNLYLRYQVLGYMLERAS